MIRLSHAELRKLTPKLASMKRSLATSIDYDGIMIDEHQNASLDRVAALNPPAQVVIAPSPIKAVPGDQWPIWANTIAMMATSADKGVGDTIHRKLGVGGEVFKATLKLLGVPCGCDARQEEWNALYPYAGGDV